METNLSEVLESLQTALADAAKAETALELARAKLNPLVEAAQEKRNAVDVLMRQYQSLTGATIAATPARGRKPKDPNAPKRPYKLREPSAVVDTQFRRSFTKAKNAGKSDVEALKIANETAAGTASSKGVSFTAHKKAPVK